MRTQNTTTTKQQQLRGTTTTQQRQADNKHDNKALVHERTQTLCVKQPPKPLQRAATNQHDNHGGQRRRNSDRPTTNTTTKPWCTNGHKPFVWNNLQNHYNGLQQTNTTTTGDNDYATATSRQQTRQQIPGLNQNARKPLSWKRTATKTTTTNALQQPNHFFTNAINYFCFTADSKPTTMKKELFFNPFYQKTANSKQTKRHDTTIKCPGILAARVCF